MAPIKSNNPLASYFDFFSKSGLDAAGPPRTGASGGTKYVYGSKTLHAFTSSDTFEAFEALNVDVLAIGGGGGTGNYSGATSGSGGSGIVILRYPNAFTISVGAGLTSSTTSGSGNTSITTFTAGTGTISWS